LAQAALPIFERARQKVMGAEPRPVAEAPSRGAVQPSAAPSVSPSVAPSVSPSVAPSAPPLPAAAIGGEHDFFISYSHVQTPEVAELVKALKEKDSRLNIFMTAVPFPPGRFGSS